MRILYHFKCGHVCNFYTGHYLCPVCARGKVAAIEYACKICGTEHKTKGAGVNNLKYLLCPKCRRQYANWRSCKNKGQSFIDWLFERQLKTKVGGKYNLIRKNISPCLDCAHVAHDKDSYPCNGCIRLKAWGMLE